MFLKEKKMISTENRAPNNNKFKFINLNLYNNGTPFCGYPYQMNLNLNLFKHPLIKG